MAPTTVVLLVDEEESIASVRAVCVTAGFVTVHASDAASAWPLVERHRPAVIITGRALPDGDGYAWIAELRLTLPDALIIVVGDERDLSVLDAGADVALARPIDEAELASVLQPLLATDAAPVEPRLSLVIVEPDVRLAAIMQRWLSRAFDVTVVAAGWRALEEIRRRKPDAVLAELRLPDMDASELYASIERAVPGLAERTLFMTAGFVADKTQQFLTTIPGQAIYKPFDLARLRAAIRALFD